jgi:EAL domain-containing protein (putative c-di-GMP-specific phosphodiesterase class I)
MRLAEDLTAALDRGEFVLHFQPFIALSTGKAIGVEALIRWNHPRFGTLAPGAFIGLAERSGAIVQIGSWVMCESARAARALAERGFPITVAFNVAASQLLERSFLERLDAAMECGHSPQRMIAEITETIAIADTLKAKYVLAEIRARGLGIALDDFGTGYSSLRYLLDLTVDVVKIDRSFVAGIPECPKSATIARAVIDLSHSVGATVQAEGIERAHQLEVLVDWRCDQAQGYYIARPVPLPYLLDWLSRRNGLAASTPGCKLPHIVGRERVVHSTL